MKTVPRTLSLRAAHQIASLCQLSKSLLGLSWEVCHCKAHSASMPGSHCGVLFFPFWNGPIAVFTSNLNLLLYSVRAILGAVMWTAKAVLLEQSASIWSRNVASGCPYALPRSALQTIPAIYRMEDCLNGWVWTWTALPSWLADHCLFSYILMHVCHFDDCSTKQWTVHENGDHYGGMLDEETAHTVLCFWIITVAGQKEIL